MDLDACNREMGQNEHEFQTENQEKLNSKHRSDISMHLNSPDYVYGACFQIFTYHS